MIEINLSIQNILDGHGIEISIIGMLVVFIALVLISSFISMLPSILKMVNLIYQSEEKTRTLSGNSDTTEDEILAVIGTALHAETGK